MSIVVSTQSFNESKCEISNTVLNEDFTISKIFIKPSMLSSSRAVPGSSKINKSDLYQTPAGKPLEGKDVSNLVNFLISDESNMIRGQNIIIDGGRSLVI